MGRCRLGGKREVILSSAEGLEPRFTESDPRLARVIRRNFHFHFVSGDDADEIFSHLAGDVREHDMIIRQLHPEHGSGKHVHNDPFTFNTFFFSHNFLRTGIIHDSQKKINLLRLGNNLFLQEFSFCKNYQPAHGPTGSGE